MHMHSKHRLGRLTPRQGTTLITEVYFPHCSNEKSAKDQFPVLLRSRWGQGGNRDHQVPATATPPASKVCHPSQLLPEPRQRKKERLRLPSLAACIKERLPVLKGRAPHTQTKRKSKHRSLLQQVGPRHGTYDTIVRQAGNLVRSNTVTGDCQAGRESCEVNYCGETRPQNQLEPSKQQHPDLFCDLSRASAQVTLQTILLGVDGRVLHTLSSSQSNLSQSFSVLGPPFTMHTHSTRSLL
eukprot:1160832-Pelagomonas_calceolata.AAC.2